ncbi:hypothetical protein NQ318_010269 [Aromia moschata]|uniref:ZP domain-containing protein n=1 Tax=Aromia moschata TaxID=1265417 RepID=A0AAV8YJB1_9CUCU|nr:hypothetical protein NQ318_010269 [Aromia moschata]
MTSGGSLRLLHVLSILVSTTWSAFPHSLRYTLPVTTNKIVDINLTCDSENLNVTVSLRSPFKGLLFAKDFADECKSVGTLSNVMNISLPTSGCGVRLSSYEDENGSVKMFYHVNLVIQQDRYLRQIADQEKTVQCLLKDDAFLVKSTALENALRNDIKGGHNRINHRYEVNGMDS